MWVPTAEQILPVLSITAMISTISLFFCGFPICWEIWKRGGTKDISGMPFIMGLIGASFWLRYGFLRSDSTMITVNVVGSSLFFGYSIFYLVMSKPRISFGLQLLFSISLVSLMVMLVMNYGLKMADVLGFACMTFNIACFASPLAGMRVVLRTRCTDTLPLPMCMANLAVSSQWMLYGTLINDIYVISPNACGVCLSFIQLRHYRAVSPCIQSPEKPLGDEQEDLEKAAHCEKDGFNQLPQHGNLFDLEKNLDGECVVPLLDASQPAFKDGDEEKNGMERDGDRAGNEKNEKGHCRSPQLSNTSTDESNDEEKMEEKDQDSDGSLSRNGSTARLTQKDEPEPHHLARQTLHDA
ncbi:unnamed protein product, partial [Mesorhabditis belari]|uniref:Sugar transporter SWEET1 n=1 Tax=Mesorhabditis belari TaxID=2138241 RepID=A0AAF3FS11_9BILA